MKRIKKSDRMSDQKSYQLSADCSDVMTVQLRDIDFYPRMSEETLAFNAILVIQYGSLSYTYNCSNDGHGSCTSIHPQTPNIEGHREVFQKWDKFLSSLKDEKFYETAKQLGWNLSDQADVITKSAESEVNNMLAEWCDKHNL